MLVAERGDETPIEWVHRDRRYGEKLATPDTSIADLIGEVDPIKVAEGRYLSDELTIHYGLVPRTNRGIFAINELPDLAERIQVGLLNVLEERDVQIRGYKIRLPLDLMLVASANPEDYTNRGRIITPLKDRFGAQIRTHYPLDAELEVDDHRAGGHGRSPPTASTCTCPSFMTEIVAEMSQQARRSPHINQRSGVSVRLSIANYETLVANATRRALRHGETEVVPRVSDLDALVASTAGKVEFETVDDGREEQVLDRIVKAAVLETFRARTRPEKLTDARPARSTAGSSCTPAKTSRRRSTPSCSPTCRGCARRSADLEVGETPAGVASAVEFVLEGLHLSKRLNKDAVGGRAAYRGLGAVGQRSPARQRIVRRIVAAVSDESFLRRWTGPGVARCRTPRPASDPAAAVLVLLVELAAVGGTAVDVLDRALDLRVVDHRRVARGTALHHVEVGLRVVGDVLRRMLGELRHQVGLPVDLADELRQVGVVVVGGLAERLARHRQRRLRVA